MRARAMRGGAGQWLTRRELDAEGSQERLKIRSGCKNADGGRDEYAQSVKSKAGDVLRSIESR